LERLAALRETLPAADAAAIVAAVFHFHVHVVPRYRADELRVMWRSALAPDAELAAVRARVLDPGR
jgi:diadenosine tetraphosphate (Ap4A) HIT family hydrolase